MQFAVHAVGADLREIGEQALVHPRTDKVPGAGIETEHDEAGRLVRRCR
jgi:hypothetical protein